jgi:hypothetical protein
MIISLNFPPEMAMVAEENVENKNGTRRTCAAIPV